MKYRIGAFTTTVIPRKYSLKDNVKIGLNLELQNQVNNAPSQSRASKTTPRGPARSLVLEKELIYTHSVQFSSVTQSCPTLCDPMNPSTPASLSITNSRSSLRLTSIESVMPSSHLILCHLPGASMGNPAHGKSHEEEA